MTTTTPVEPDDRPPAASPRSWRAEPRRAWAFVGVVAAVSAVVRVVLAWRVESPFLYHDEGGYLAVARWLVGSPPELYGPEYSTGYGLLLAPFAAVADPGQLHHLGQLLNTAAAVAAIPLAHLVGRRVVGLSPWTSAVAAVVGTTTAASVVQATMLLPEQLLVLVSLGVVLGVHETVQRRSGGWALATGLVAGAGYGLHARSLVVPIALALTVAAAWWLGSLSRRLAVTAVIAAAVPVVGFQALQVRAADALYPVGAWVGVQRSPPASVDEATGTLLIGLGQVWYVLVATAGLALAGVVVAAGRARRQPRSAAGAAALVSLLGFLGALGLAAVASYGITLDGRVPRPDQTVYGRYVESWIPVLVLYAPLLLARLRAPVLAATGALVAATGLIVRAGFPGETWSQPVAWHNVASARPLIEAFGDDFLVAASLTAAAVALVMALATRLDHRAWVVPLLVMAGLNGFGGPRLVDRWAEPSSVSWADRHRLGPVLEATGLPVAVDGEDVLESFWAYNVQFWHPDVDIDLVRAGHPSDAPLRLDSLATPPAPGALLVGSERDGDLGLWALDRAASDAIAAAGGAPGAGG